MRIGWLLAFLIGVAPSEVLAGAIHDAAKTGDVAALAAILDAGADVDESDGNAPPIYYAVRRGHLDALKLLIERGADVNAGSTFGPPLTVAAAKGRAEFMALLLEHGANADVQFNGEAAIHAVIKLKCLPCVELLVKAGADVNLQTKDRQTAMHFARLYGYREIADFLTANGAVALVVPPIADKLAAANVERGKQLFEKTCSGCHSVEENKKSMQGPSLWDVVGRNKASLADTNYSDALKALDGVWTYEEINALIAAPMAAMPGVKMDVAGVEGESERVDIIAFLRTLSDSPKPLQ
jgi:cytochrome c